MSLLITPTLLDSYDWFLKAPPSWKEKAWKDLTNKLNRTKWEPSPRIVRGTDFEKQVYRFCNKDPETFGGSDIFKQVCAEFKGCEQQFKIKRVIEVDDVEYLLYGKADGWWTSEIKDLKTTGNYKGQSKYLGGWQHKIYCYASAIPKFKYVVVEWDPREKDPKKLVPGEVFIIPYEMTDRELVRDEIKNKIHDFIEFIDQDDELSEAYYHKFNLYN